MVADEPQPLVSLASAVERPVADVRRAVQRLVADYDGVDGGVRRGFELREVGGGWRIYVRPEYDSTVRDFVLTQSPARLSQAALETLAVVAYLGPVTRPEIARIRGVAAESAVAGLLERGLIAESGRDASGALRYETTVLFERVFGLADRSELPALDDLGADADELRARLESLTERRGA